MYFVFAYLRHSTSVSIKVIVNRQHENIFFSNNLFLEGTQVPAWPNGPALMLREKVGIIFVRLNNQSSFMCFTMFQFHRIGFQTDVAVESKCLVIKWNGMTLWRKWELWASRLSNYIPNLPLLIHIRHTSTGTLHFVETKDSFFLRTICWKYVYKHGLLENNKTIPIFLFLCI